MKRLPGGIALVVAVAILGSCGGTAAKVKNLATGASTGDVQKVLQQVQNAQKLVFTADYQSTDSGGKSQTIHVAQKPPKSIFKTNDATVINDGTNTYTCSASGSNNEIQCLKTAGGASGSAAAVATALSGAAVVTALSAAAVLPGFDAKQSTRDIAGQHLTCVTITKSASNTHPEYCITQDGIIGYVADDSGTTFSLTSFKKDVSDSEFTPPGKVVSPDDIANQATSGATSTTVTTATTDTTNSSDTTSTSDTTDTTTP